MIKKVMVWEEGSALNIAIVNNDIKTALGLIDSKYYSMLDDGIIRYFELACDLNRTEIAIKFIEEGMFIHELPTLQIASLNGNIELTKYFYFHALNIKESFNGASLGESICEAVHSGNLEVVDFLISVKADVNYEEERPLSISAQKGFVDIAKLLVSHGAKVKANRGEALRNAKKYQQGEMVNYLSSLY